MNSIFPKFSLNREDIRWEDYLQTLTPWENHQGVWFKREDYFAPLSYGGPNGAKCRQLIHLMNTQREGKSHVLSGASLKSPQLSMSTIIGAHYGLPARLVVGATKPETMLKHPNPRISAGFGAKFEYISVAYNPQLQKKVEELTKPSSLVVRYGITLDHLTQPIEDVLAFHEVGANQVKNLPEEVEVLIVPAGSCNSLVSVLLGLSRDSKNLKRLFTLGIGPNKMDWVAERCAKMGINLDALPFKWKHHSLHDSGFSTYQDMMPESFDGIQFHPTYEGKMIRYLKSEGWIPQDGTVGFWIVGSEPDLKVLEPFYTQAPETVIGEAPEYQVDKVAKALYDACSTVKPKWEQLGDVTRGVWCERAETNGVEE